MKALTQCTRRMGLHTPLRFAPGSAGGTNASAPTRSLLILGCYLDFGFLIGEDFADLDGGDSRLNERFGEGLALRRADEEASGGLGVVEEGAEVVGDLGIVFDEAFGEVAVVGEASGNVSGVDAVEGAGK